MQVLLIHSFAGSLLIAAKQAKLSVVGSYERDGYGLNVQRLNYPHVDYRPTRRDWPKDNLSNTIVIGHPPCAPFSVTGGQKGLADPRFQSCTLDTLHYAFQHQAAVVALESVCRTYQFVKPIYDELALAQGYSIFYIFLDSATFGVPQRRPRFWSIFFKDCRQRWRLNYEPLIRTVSMVLDQSLGQTVLLPAWRDIVGQLRYLREIGISDLDLARVLSGRFGYGKLLNILLRTRVIVDRGSAESNRRFYCKSYYLGSTASQVWGDRIAILLDPGGVSPTLLGTKRLVYQGFPVLADGYKKLMGFPVNYLFGCEKDTKFLIYLTQGICPPIGSWLLQQIVAKDNAGLVQAEAGYLLDLRPSASELAMSLAKIPLPDHKRLSARRAKLFLGSF